MPVIPPAPEGASAAELVVDRLNTRAMIAANPVAITLIPRVLWRTGTGGRWEDLEPRPLQIGRLIDPGTGFGTAGEENADDGVQRKDNFQLLLPENGEVELNDYWDGTDGIRYEVTGILPYNGYERRAEVTRFGKEGQPLH